MVEIDKNVGNITLILRVLMKNIKYDIMFTINNNCICCRMDELFKHRLVVGWCVFSLFWVLLNILSDYYYYYYHWVLLNHLSE